MNYKIIAYDGIKKKVENGILVDQNEMLIRTDDGDLIIMIEREDGQIISRIQVPLLSKSKKRRQSLFRIGDDFDLEQLAVHQLIMEKLK